MITPIQKMEYYLCTGVRESSIFAGENEDKKKGLCQENTAALSTWQQIGGLVIAAQFRHRHCVTIQSPISKKSIRKVGTLFVNNTNLRSGLSEDSDLEELVLKTQDGIYQWGKLLITVFGGALNPQKCSWTAHNMVPNENGNCVYRDEE